MTDFAQLWRRLREEGELALAAGAGVGEDVRRVAGEVGEFINRGSLRNPQLEAHYAPRPRGGRDGLMDEITVTAPRPRLAPRARNAGARIARGARNAGAIAEAAVRTGAAGEVARGVQDIILARPTPGPVNRMALELTGVPATLEAHDRGLEALRAGDEAGARRAGADTLYNGAMAASVVAPEIGAAARGVGAMRARPLMEAAAALQTRPGTGRGGALATGAGLAAATLTPAAASAQDASSAGSLEAARARVAELEQNARRFESVNRRDPGAVRQTQEFLQSQGLYGEGFSPDGVWGQGTTDAVRQYLATIPPELEAARARVAELEEFAAADATRAGPLHQAARFAAPYAGLMLGAGIGHVTRRGAVQANQRATAARAAMADALLTEGPVISGRSAAAQAAPLRRAANINDFWRLGGAGEAVPYRQGRTGFTRRPKAAEPSALFPPGPELFRGNDWAAMAVAGGDAVLSHTMLMRAEEEVAAARAAVSRAPGNRAALARLEAARDAEAFWGAARAVGVGLGGGRLGSAYMDPYKPVRPNIAAAEGERALLDRAFAPRQRPPRRPRRASP